MAAATVASSAPAGAQAQAAPPDQATMQVAAEKAVRGALLLPKSARFAWPAGFKPGAWRPYNSREVRGWLTCGLVYAKDKFGYETVRVFITVVHDGKAFADFDSQPEGPVQRACATLRLPQPTSEAPGAAPTPH